ncbi:O-antigen ligase family protein [Clostridium tertium]
MKSYKINVKDLLVNISLLIYFSIILLRPYLIKFLGSNNVVLILLFCSISLLFFSIVLSKKIKKNNIGYIVLCILMCLPFFYKNAYIQDKYYTYMLYFLGTIAFCIILSFIKLEEKNISFIIRILIVFAFISSLVTWISFIFPNIYDSIFISLLPNEDQLLVRNDFWKLGMKMGLSNHYSRNAFYIVSGIIGCIIMRMKKKKKIYDVFTCIFFITLLLIGKRAHFLFLILSLIISYGLYKKFNMKKIINIIKYIIIGAILLIIAITVIPGTFTVIERLFNLGGGDISTGRFELYHRVWDLFHENSYRAIGWGQFSKSTNYFFAGVHNDYLQLLCETGVVGLGLILYSNLYILIKTINLARKNKGNSTLFGVLIYQVFFMLYSLTGLPHYDTETYMIYFIFTCLIWNNLVYKENHNV